MGCNSTHLIIFGDHRFQRRPSSNMRLVSWEYTSLLAQDKELHYWPSSILDFFHPSAVAREMMPSAYALDLPIAHLPSQSDRLKNGWSISILRATVGFRKNDTPWKHIAMRPTREHVFPSEVGRPTKDAFVDGESHVSCDGQKTGRYVFRRGSDTAHERSAASRPHHSTKAAQGDGRQGRQSQETQPAGQGRASQRRSMIRSSRRRCLISRSNLFRLTRLPVCQPFSLCALDRFCSAFDITDAQSDPLVVAKIEFGQIPL